MTLNDPEWHNSPKVCVISPNLVAFGEHYVKVVEYTPHILRQKCSPKNVVFSNMSAILAGITPVTALK